MTTAVMPAGLRNVRVVSVTSSDFEELLVAGLEELAMRYDKDTLEQLARWRLKFLNFETELQKASPSATLSDVLPAYNAYLRRGARGTAQGNRHSTVYHNMWMTRRAMQYLEGREIGGSVVRRRPSRQPAAIRAHNEGIPTEVRRVGRAHPELFLWLSTQRGGNVLDVAPEDLMMDPERPGVATMCYLTRRKGQTLVERLMPVVQEWELGPFENLLQRWRGIALRNPREPFAPRERSEPEQVEPPMLNRGLGRRRAASETERELAVLPQMVLRGGRALRRGEIHQ